MGAIIRMIPLLVYEDIERAHDFLVRAFGFEPGDVERDADGNVIHGEVRSADHVIWLHCVTEEHDLASPTGGGPATSGLSFMSTTSTRTSLARDLPAHRLTANREIIHTVNASTGLAISRDTAGGSLHPRRKLSNVDARGQGAGDR
jgi:hypothetical protein